MRLDEFKQPIKEGGNAVKMSTRINQDNVKATLTHIYEILLPRLKVNVDDTASLGSTGKKASGDSSGDIDLAVSVQALVTNNKIETPQELYDFITEVANEISPEVKDMRGIGIVSMAWPIVNVDGKQKGQYVQLDVMTVDSVEWAKWAYYAPSFNDSPWKGLYRNELLYALAKEMNYETVAKAMTDSGEEVDTEWKRDFFDLSKGLLTGTQTRMGKKGIVKTVKTIDKVLKSNDPADVVQMMFGPDVKPKDVLTWEDTFRMINDPKFIYSDKRDSIFKMAKQGILNKGFPVPPELNKEV